MVTENERRWMTRGAQWARRPDRIARFEANLAARLEYGRRRRAVEDAMKALSADEARTAEEWARRWGDVDRRTQAALAARGGVFYGTPGAEHLQRVAGEYQQRAREALAPYQEQRRRLAEGLKAEGAELGSRATAYFRDLLRGQQDYWLRRAALGLRGAELKARLALAEQQLPEAPDYRRPVFPLWLQKDYYGYPYYGVFDKGARNFMGDPKVVNRGWGPEIAVPLRKTAKTRLAEAALALEYEKERRIADYYRWLTDPERIRREAREKAQAAEEAALRRSKRLFSEALWERMPEMMQEQEGEPAGAVSLPEVEAIMAGAMRYGLSTDEAAEILAGIYGIPWAESLKRYAKGLFGKGASPRASERFLGLPGPPRYHVAPGRVGVRREMDWGRTPPYVGVRRTPAFLSPSPGRGEDTSGAAVEPMPGPRYVVPSTEPVLTPSYTGATWARRFARLSLPPRWWEIVSGLSREPVLTPSYVRPAR